MRALTAVATSLAAACLGPPGAVADTSLDVLGWLDTRAPCLSVRDAPGGILITAESGVALVDVTVPGEPVEIAFVPGPPATRRDAVWHDDHVYAVSDGGGGLQIVDWSRPDAPSVVDEIETWFETALGIVRDPVLDRLLVFGTPTGLHALSIDDPTLPEPAWTTPFSAFDVLDVVPLGGLAHVATGVSSALVNLASTPDLVAWITYPGATPHALADDARRLSLSPALAVADGDRVSLLSTARLSDIRLVASIGDDDGASGAPVAVARQRDRIAVAWESARIDVYDTTDLEHPVAVASRAVGSELRAVAFARTPDVLFACDATLGLVTLALDDRWALLEGFVRDDGTGALCPDVRVRDVASGRSTITSALGAFRLRVPPGTREIELVKFGFFDDEVVVETGPGEAIPLDRGLVPRPTGEVRGTITLPSLTAHPEGTIVRLLDTPIAFPAQLTGDYFLPQVPAGDYLVEVDAMGSATSQVPITVEPGQTTRRDFFLSASVYTHTFESENGWLVGGPDDDATAGTWTRAMPVGTAAGYVQPLADETPPPGTHAFVTGNGAPGDWLDVADVDGGRTTLTSPVIDLLGVEDPIFRYYRWLSLDARWEDEIPDGDRFEAWISADGGITWRLVEERARSDHRWVQVDYRLDDHADITSAMRFRFVIADRAGPSIVEAAIDDVEIFPGTGLERPPDYTPIGDDPDGPAVAPPTADVVDVRASDTRLVVRYRVRANVRSVRVALYDVTGRRLRLHTGPAGPGIQRVDWSLDADRPVPSGRYLLELDAGGHRVTRPVLVLR